MSPHSSAAFVLTVGIGLGAAVAMTAHAAPRGLDLYMPIPDDNPQTPAKIALGRRLFFDQRLSRDGSTSCSTCHVPSHAFANGLRLAVGLERRLGTRNVPTLVNRGYGGSFFWDGRATSLEAQVIEPIRNPQELDSSLSDVVYDLETEPSYSSAFRLVFKRNVNPDDVARSLASFVRTIVSGDSAFDRAIDGQPHAMSPGAQRGMGIFLGKGNCWLCHRGPTLTDEGFHNTGVAWRVADGKAAPIPSDLGRAAVTGNAEDRGAFKTPTLREVARTAPYMHDGSFRTLREIIDYYDRGAQPNPGLDVRIQPLHLTVQEKIDLLAFLMTLRGRVSEGQ